MVNAKMHGFYGVSCIMLLAANDQTIHDLFSCVSNASGARLLNSLYLEARELRYVLYKSGCFRYVSDDDSLRGKNLIKYADFYISYKKYMADLEAAVASNAIESYVPDLSLDEGKADNSISSEPAIIDLDLSLNNEDMVRDMQSEGQRDIDANGIDLFDMPDVNAGLARVDLSLDTDLAIEGSLDLEANGLDLGAQVLQLSDGKGIDLDGPSNIIEQDVFLDGNFDLDLLSQVSVNDALLEKYSKDQEFFREFENMNYGYVIGKIKDWSPSVIVKLRGILPNESELKEYKLLNSRIVSLKQDIEKLKTGDISPLTEVRIAGMEDELRESEEDISQLRLRLEYFDDKLISLINYEEQFVPRKLLNMHYTATGYTEMAEKEYALVSALHSIASERVGDKTRLDSIIDKIYTNMVSTSSSARKYLNMDYAALSTRESYNSLLKFNRRYHDFLYNFQGQDYITMAGVGLRDCNDLLAQNKPEQKENLKKAFVSERLDKNANSSQRINLNGLRGVAYAVDLVAGDTHLRDLFSLTGFGLDVELLKEFFAMFAESTKIMQLSSNEEGFAALYKIWLFVNKYSLQTVLSSLGVFQEYSMEDLRNLYIKFDIPGIYGDFREIFKKCCEIGVAVTNRRKEVIREKRSPHLYENLKVISRFLVSTCEMHMNKYAPVYF